MSWQVVVLVLGLTFIGGVGLVSWPLAMAKFIIANDRAKEAQWRRTKIDRGEHGT